jgi:hypothetical protein
MSYINKYLKYKSKYLELSNQLLNNKQTGGSKHNFIIIDTIRGSSEFIQDLKKNLKLLNDNVIEYKFKFLKDRFNLDDLTFESVSDDIKTFIDKKELSNNIIICLEESSPYGLFFADKYPEMCKAIICYPLRLNTKESLDRLYHKYVEKKGWKYISEKYDPIDYFFEINDDKLSELFDKNGDEEKNIIELLINLQLRKQYNKIPTIFKVSTYLFSRLDMDAISTIKLNFERKDIAEMKGIISPDDAIYTSMMWNIARVQYDKELMELNKENNFLRIHHVIAFEINEDVRLISDAVKILIYN